MMIQTKLNPNVKSFISVTPDEMKVKILCFHLCPSLEGIFLEINLKKSKWLVFGDYNLHEDNISNFMNQLGPCLDHYMHKYENFLLLGDFNS